MPRRRIDSRVEIGAVRLRTPDLDRLVAFYGDLLGFDITERLGPSTLFLGAERFRPLVVLERDDRPPRRSVPARVVLRFPDRAALANAFRAVSQAGIAVERAEDEGVREVIYLLDPDGNQVEMYYDRSREDWSLDDEGQPRIERRPLDLDSLGREPRVDADDSVAQSPPPTSLSAATRARLADVRSRLLNLHKVLLDDARTAYEMDRGRVGSSASLLQLVINDPWFAWLHPLSELVVRIDETLQPEAPATEADGAALLEQIERLLSPADPSDEFAQRYHEALQRQPAVVLAHAEVRRILKQVK